MAALARQQKYETQLATCERRYGQDATGGDPSDPTLPYDSETRSACNSETARRIIEESTRIIRPEVPTTGEQLEIRQNEMVAEVDIRRHLVNQDSACKTSPDSCACRQWNKDYAFFLNKRYGDLWIMDGMQAQISQETNFVQNRIPSDEAEEPGNQPLDAYRTNAQICSEEKRQMKALIQLTMKLLNETEEEVLEGIEQAERACLMRRTFIDGMIANDNWVDRVIPEKAPFSLSEIMAGFPNFSIDSCQ
ncbi:hypothetical protein [Loktanella sp. M215]|uniref:hypothetical protein n=1 Tax=Loktanella sp. M215 TaxID=2675431 RepID=UPI001F3D7CE6|nr:hypothetical protein [Loktanella sp. M215]MCF7702437.1 hypothetical protein [Loktanella sp. M215]